MLHGEPFDPLSIHERKRKYSVHAFFRPMEWKKYGWKYGVWEIYYQKDGFPMMYVFGLPNYQECEDKWYDEWEIMDIAWSNLPKYRKEFR